MTTALLETSYAGIIDRLTGRIHEELRETFLGHQEALEELHEVYHECQEADWDGHHAAPVEQDTHAAAYRLIGSLPLGFPRPTIGAEPDGQLTLEWRRSKRRVLSVSVDPDGYLHYAGLFGMNRCSGRFNFYGTVPDELMRLVWEL